MEDLKKTAVMTKERCRALADALKEKMVLGLAGGESDLKMLPTYVTSFPTGKESGHFLALDLVSLVKHRHLTKLDSSLCVTRFETVTPQACLLLGQRPQW